MIYTVMMYLSLGLFFILSIITGWVWRRSTKQGISRFSQLTLIVDTLVMENAITGNHNRVYKNLAINNDIIDHYILSDESGKSFLICHTQKAFTGVPWLKVECFDKHEKPVGLLWTDLAIYNGEIPTIQLPKKTRFVNVKLETTQSDTVDVKDPKALKQLYKRLSLWISMTLFFLWVPIGYFILEALIGERFVEFLNIRTLLLGLVLMLIMIFLHYALFRFWSKKRVILEEQS